MSELTQLEWTVWFDSGGAGADVYLLGAPMGVHREILGQLEAAGETESCFVGIPLARAD